ncbi:hypothetical protein F2Q68_00016554 [Brassica cretica]|uniref:Uncharacterized protein n=1 Tax=Brassica cretica TaxID=69181 RepID=A0A8S9HF78_BRACR|nr:hypothetical protein F2Q68_00016554 [Brassica cretica]
MTHTEDFLEVFCHMTYTDVFCQSISTLLIWNKGKGIAGRQSGSDNLPSGARQHHTNLADKIMPLLAPSIPPGFEPYSSIVAPEVFEQMRLYMNCSDPEERIIREAKMKKTLNELS